MIAVIVLAHPPILRGWIHKTSALTEALGAVPKVIMSSIHSSVNNSNLDSIGIGAASNRFHKVRNRRTPNGHRDTGRYRLARGRNQTGFTKKIRIELKECIFDSFHPWIFQ